MSMSMVMLAMAAPWRCEFLSAAGRTLHRSEIGRCQLAGNPGFRGFRAYQRKSHYEYERNGTASIFMFAEPLSGFRQATAREQRTKVDWAIEVANLLDTRYADCAQITLVCDNLNTHTKGAFYTAFPPELARAYVKRINFCYTPKHGSWLNVAECELSCLTSQCLSDRRIGELPLLQAEIGTWADKTNAKQRGVDWQFKIDDARTKLKRLYPKIKSG
jgi:hypothetical protein